MNSKFDAINFNDVCTRRGAKDVLHHLSFSIGPSECVAILGPNGSGKSTLIKLMTRELYPTHGAVKMFGQEDWDVFELRSRLGIVSNDLQSTFTRHMTGFETVVSGFFSSVGVWQNNRITRKMEMQTDQVLKQLGIRHLRKRRMDGISSGEARRLLIARALVHNPTTLVFDEPTNSLDLSAQRELRLTLHHLTRMGLGIVLATHHLADIPPEMGRIIGLKSGSIVVDGPKEKILTPSRLRAIFGVSLTVVRKNGLYHAY